MASVRTVATACGVAVALVACGGAPRKVGTATATSGSAKPARALREACAGAPYVEVNAASNDASSFAPNASSKARGESLSAELQSLERKGAWDEVLERADDLPAPQRSAAWEKLVARAAIAVLRDYEATSSFDAIFRTQSLVKRYPHLAQSKAMSAERARAIPIATEACLADAQRGRRCVDGVKEWLRTPGTPPDVALALAKMVRARQNPYVAAPLFAWTLEHAPQNRSLCDDDDLRTATATALALPDEYEEAAAARAIAAGPCWDTMKDGLRTTLETASVTYFRDNACAVMKAKGAL